jgi:hypothetical protein
MIDVMYSKQRLLWLYLHDTLGNFLIKYRVKRTLILHRKFGDLLGKSHKQSVLICLNRWLGPLLHRTSKLTVIRPSLQIRVCAYGMGILLRVVMRIRTNRPQIQPRMVMVAANLHTRSLNTFFSIGNFCKEVMFGV